MACLPTLTDVHRTLVPISQLETMSLHGRLGGAWAGPPGAGAQWSMVLLPGQQSLCKPSCVLQTHPAQGLGLLVQREPRAEGSWWIMGAGAVEALSG